MRSTSRARKLAADGEALGLGARRELATDALDRLGERRPRRACRRPSAAARRAAPRCPPCRPGRRASRREATPASRRAAYRASPSARARAPFASTCCSKGGEPHAAARRSLRVRPAGRTRTGASRRAINAARIIGCASAGCRGARLRRGRRLEHTQRCGCRCRSTVAAAARTSSAVMLSYSPGASNSLRKSPWKTS